MIQSAYKKSALNQVAQSQLLDVEGLASLVIELTGTFVGTVIFEYTINGTDWYTMSVTVNQGTAVVTGATAVGIWTVNVAGFKAVRVRCTAFTSGTINAALRAIFSGGGSAGSGGAGAIQTAGADAASNTVNMQSTDSRISGFNGTTWDRIRTAVTTISSTFTGFLNSLPWAIYHATPTTRTDGQGGPFEADTNGNLKSTLATLIAGENLVSNRLNNEPIYNPTSITTQTTTTVKSGAGTLGGILIPTPVASATIKIYDNTAASGTVLVDTITFPVTLLNDGPIFIKVDTTFATGCTVVTAGATMAVDVYTR